MDDEFLLLGGKDPNSFNLNLPYEGIFPYLAYTSQGRCTEISKTFMYTSASTFVPHLPNDKIQLYHATTAEKALNILKMGSVSTMSKTYYDFNSCFYLVDRLDFATEWAQKVSKIQNPGVVLVNDVSLTFLTPLLSLGADSEDWAVFVSSFRRKNFHDINWRYFYSHNFIAGPWVRNPRQTCQGAIPIPYGYQIAAITPAVSLALEQYFERILFFDQLLSVPFN